ncbi:hypothetical protein BGZ92_011317 [Podila epicladia]|nr:hypothetical protein BGZ92_011317 [Podila epicladia]
MTKPPGYITTQFPTDVGRTETAESKESHGFRKTTRMMDVTSMKSHLQQFTHPDFDAHLYNGHGYILKGSIKTNGHLIQVLAFKLHELQCVWYRRLPVDKMPNPLTSSIGGTDKYLTEIRNVTCGPDDFGAIWGCPPEEVSIFTLDLGTEGLVEATVLPADGITFKVASNSKTEPTIKNFDLVVKRKAVAQPTKKLAHWIESQKRIIKVGADSTVSGVESGLPPLRGEGASVQQYVQARRAVEKDLDTFYNKSNYVKHVWDAERAQEEEFLRVTNSLLKMVGGSIDERIREDQKVVIAIGLAKFVSKNGPPSLDGSFQDFFMRKACSLGYTVVGINEYYTRQRCLDCEGFVCKTNEWRRLYCQPCKKIWQRDVMASKNMCHAVKSHLVHQRRPFYLQPQRVDGTFLWMECSSLQSAVGSDEGGSGKSSEDVGQEGSSTSDESVRIRKRQISDSDSESDQAQPSQSRCKIASK